VIPRKSLGAAFAAVAGLVISPSTSAQQYPTKPVKILVGFAAGGGTDLTARFIARELSSAMAQQFIVENKPGAGGSIAFAAGAEAPPDGYTLTMISVAYAVNPAIYKVKFDPMVDMTPIVQTAEGPLIIVANPKLPVKTVGDLIALAKAKPGQLTYATPGQGGTSHLAAELLSSMAGIRMNHIPYKGGAPALTDTIAGQTDLCFNVVSSTLPHVRSGRLRAIAVTSAKRMPSEPNIPTVAESGVPGYEVNQWYGIIGPRGLPAPVVTRLNGEVAQVLKTKEAADHLRNEGLVPASGTPDQFRALIGKELQAWRKVVTDIGLKAE
jgi:tripartite-type tricarboxylate transporter receptor subunit TctC